MKILCVVLVLSLAWGQSTLAQYDDGVTPSPQSATANPTTNPSEQVKVELEQIVMADDYSKVETVSHWERNSVPEERQPSAFEKWLEKWLGDAFGEVDLNGVSQGVGLLGKTIALLFLALLVWWLYRTKEVWLSWFSAFKPPTRPHADPTPAPIWREREVDWVNLPVAHELADFIKSLLAKGLWLPALSALYRGTLRELGVRHQLPIAHHQTENECLWLLAQSPAGTQERAYFEKLVNLWRVYAYGQQAPKEAHQADINELLTLWTHLYGGRT